MLVYDYHHRPSPDLSILPNQNYVVIVVIKR